MKGLLAIIALLGIGGAVLFASKSHQAAKEAEMLRAELATLKGQPPADGSPRNLQTPPDPEVIEPPEAEPGPETRPPVGPPTLDAQTRDRFVKALLMADGGDRFKALSELGIQLSSEEFATALGGLSSSQARYNHTRSILANWVEVDAQAAAQWAMDNDSQKYSMAIRTVAGLWGQKDPDAAGAWLSKLPAGNNRDMAMQQIIQHIARDDPKRAVQMLEEMGNENLQSWAATSVAREYVRKDPEAAALWIENLPAGRGRDTAVQQLVFSFAQKDPVAALEWAETIQDEQVRNTSLPTIGMYWAKQDPTAAAEWVETMPEGRTRDMTIQSFAREIMKTDPVVAMEWTETIQDKNLRDNSRYYVASQWLTRDPAAAKEWAEASDLPENLKKNLMQRKAPRGSAGAGNNQSVIVKP